MDESGREVKGAGPSTPVRVLGWKDLLPSPGERVYEVLNERQGTNIVSYRKKKNMEKKADEDWVCFVSFCFTRNQLHFQVNKCKKLRTMTESSFKPQN